MNMAWRIAAALPAVLLVAFGVGWWFSPALMAGQLGMVLQTEAGLSSQVGDIASFFLTVGACMLLAIWSGNRLWAFPALMLLTFAVGGRLIAWLFHGAALTVAMIATELVLITLFLIVSRKLRPAA